MMIETLTIGPAPAEEPCAQLGSTELFEQANLLEIRCYRAALVACYGAPPAGAGFHIERNVHDFGTYRELAARFDPDDETAMAWAYQLEEGLARWIDADFIAPVIYDDRSQVAEFACTDHFDAARRAMLLMERLRIDGHGTIDQAVRLAHLRAAYLRLRVRAPQHHDRCGATGGSRPTCIVRSRGIAGSSSLPPPRREVWGNRREQSTCSTIRSRAKSDTCRARSKPGS